MRLGIVTTQAPFITGGAERHSANLVAALRARGHEATEISLPYKWFPARVLVDHVLAAKLTDLSDLGYPVDRVIGLKFPAWLVRHPDKVFWVLHQHRQAYDLWEAGLSELQRDPDGAAVRELIRAEDRAAFTAPGARVWANSANVAARMRRYLGVEGTPLYHPPPSAGALRADGYGDYLFAPSRLGPNKRQKLMIEAMAHAPRHLRLVIAGPPDDPRYPDELRALARERGVADRVELVGAISDEEMIRHYAGARAVVFVPVDEDYGYITLEAMLSARPVITATDSGGPLEFVRDGVEGLVVAPEAAALGAAFARVLADRAEAERMGQAGLAAYRAKDISWDTVVATLTDGAAPDPAAAPSLAEPSGRAAQPQRPDASASTPVKVDAPASGPAAPDLAALAARIAAPEPAAPPVTCAEALAAADAVVTDPGDRRAGTPEWRRMMAVLAQLETVQGGRILDLAPGPSTALPALLAAARPEAEIAGIWRGDRPCRQTVRTLTGDRGVFHVTLYPACAPPSLPDAAFDILLALDGLSSPAAAPAHLLAEAHRLLAPGGHLLVTAPNRAGHRGLAALLAGPLPATAPAAAPGAMLPGALAALGEAAGFETVSLATADLDETVIDPETAALLTSRGDDFRMRGDTVLWLARKAEGLCPAPSGRLRLVGREGATLTLGARNTGPADWPAQGEGAIGLALSWVDARGVIRHGGLNRALPGPVAPGEEATLALLLDADPAAAEGRLRVALVAGGLPGPLAVLETPCSAAAFRRLAEAG